MDDVTVTSRAATVKTTTTTTTTTTAAAAATTSQFGQEWKRFKRALFKSKDSFNPYRWIYRLLNALWMDVQQQRQQYIPKWLTNAIRRLLLNWRPIIPMIAMSIIVLIAASYFFKLRTDLILSRWCQYHHSDGNNNTCNNHNDCKTVVCYWVYVHDVVVAYITSMILYHFVQSSIQSPGIMIVPNNSENNQRRRRRRRRRRINVDQEHQLLHLYGDIQKRQQQKETINTTGTSCDDNNDNYHPSPYGSICQKCNIAVDTTVGTNTGSTNCTADDPPTATIVIRPPRCHHCSICNVCVLQYDHHCVWINNCVGLNNVRHFILLLIYISVGCYYGILVLYRPFYSPLQDLLRQHGGLIQYIVKYRRNELPIHERTLFDFPTLEEVVRLSCLSGNAVLPVQVIIDIVFPFLLGVGCVMTIFLGTHIKLILMARTTVEHKMYLEHQYNTLLPLLLFSTGSIRSPSTTTTTRRQRIATIPSDDTQNNTNTNNNSTTSSTLSSTWTNPFDQKSYYRNWIQIMGHHWMYLWLPIRIRPPPPHIPIVLTTSNTTTVTKKVQ